MAGLGAAPKPNARKPNQGLGAAASVRLPAAGRTGAPPKWPLPEVRPRELELWKRLWKTPQSAQWELMGWEDVVARYVRIQVDAEQIDAQVARLAEARQHEDRLGLNPLALLRLRWVIVEDEVGAESGEKVVDIRRRLSAVE
jgi:hypothetical protein